MIEQALRDQLRPIVRRRKSLYLAVRLSIAWFVLGLLGAGLVFGQWYWGWQTSEAGIVLALWMLIVTVYVVYQSRGVEPDYRQIARTIERDHPELKALLLTAVEQKAKGPDGQLGYMQERVIGEALRHASRTNWTRSIPLVRLLVADVGALAGLVFVLSMVWPSLPRWSRQVEYEVAPAVKVAPKGWNVTVTPGDAEVEAGSPVVVLARFDGELPPTAKLVYTTLGQGSQQVMLTKNLEDPVFGGVISSVAGDTVYRVEYSDRETKEYKLTTFAYPAMQKADARIVYPEYTSLPEKVVENTRQVSVVEGSDVTLTFTLNKPVETARLEAKDGSVVELTGDANRPGVYVASMKPVESRRYELLLADAEGRKNKMPPRFAIDVHKNLPAELKAKFPNRDISASPLEELTLEAEVSDDYGLTSYGVTYTVAGLESMEAALGPREIRGRDALDTRGQDALDTGIEHGQDARATDGDSAARRGVTGKQSIDYLLALEELNAQPDQLVTYYFWADDVGPNGENRRSYSDIYFAEIRPFEEIFRESEQSAGEREQQEREQQENQENQEGEQSDQQRAEELVRLQKEIISATWNVKRRADQAGGLEKNAEDLDVVTQSQDDALQQAQEAQGQAADGESAAALEAAVRHMQTSLEHLTQAAESVSSDELMPALGAEQAAYQELLKLRERESQVAQSRSQSQSQSQSARSQQQLQQLEMRQQQDRYETQREAQPQQEAEQRQDLQMQNRLRELARRQEDMSERIRELEASLRQAQTQQERQEAERELERLRQQQLQSLQDVDELQAQMDQPENRQRTQEASQQLDQTREQVRQSAEQLQERMVSEAAASAARAGREFDEMREEFQNRTGGRFNEEMQGMREEARELDERQGEISEQIAQEVEQQQQRSLTDPPTGQELAQEMEQQQARARELMERMRDVSEAAEESEPVLYRRLYDTLREASTGDLDRAMDLTGELLSRNFLPEAQEIEQRAAEGVRQLREGVEEAAEGVLGNEGEALRQAREQVEELIRQVNEEMVREGRAGRGDPNASQAMDDGRGTMDEASQRGGRGGDPNAVRDGNEPSMAQGGRNGQPQEGQQQDAQAREGQQGQQGQQNQQQQARDGQQQQEGQQGQQGQQQAGQRQGQGQQDQQQAREGQQGGQPRDGQAGQRDNERPGGVERADQYGGPGGIFRDWTNYEERQGPITGRDFRQWSDRLREVEEMLTTRELREQAARVRDQAQEMRNEVTRHGKEPQWDVVEQQITKPLTELYQRLSEQLVRLESDESLVPIDRDPVPGRFNDLVRTYFEKLGDDEE